MNTFDILLKSREQIADLFKKKYVEKVRLTETIKGESYGYHYAGFGVNGIIEVRMQIKDTIDEKRHLHYARFIPRGKQHNYFVQMVIAEIEMKHLASVNDESNCLITDRHEFLNMPQDKEFKMPDDGIGISLDYDQPQRVAKKLIAIDNLIDEVLKKPCEDKKILKIVNDYNKLLKEEDHYIPFY